MSNTITTAEFRSWVNLIADGPDGSQQFFSKYVDPNVDWTVTTPATGALGKTTPIAGEHFRGAMIGPDLNGTTHR